MKKKNVHKEEDAEKIIERKKRSTYRIRMKREEGHVVLDEEA